MKKDGLEKKYFVQSFNYLFSEAAILDNDHYVTLRNSKTFVYQSAEEKIC